ncbi:MAG TPA: secretin N-terminal domain-containing protein, partial [Phycisphaerales bacterium]|nr:secretin N-terminal domain-containing protein [Phycisphaerales bacterium]
GPTFSGGAIRVQPPAEPPVVSPETAPPAVTGAAKTDPLGRRIGANTADTVLAFPKATVEQLIPFIAESTGKAVLPSQTVLPIRITVINDKPIPRGEALDLVFFALQQAGVAVIEREDRIILTEQAKVALNPVIPVLGADKSTLQRGDLGSLYQKFFALKHASAANLAEIIKTSVPENATVQPESDSQTLIVTASIATLQRVERIVNELDRAPADLPKSETFHLRYANPEDVATWITALFGDTANNPNRARNNQGNQGGQGGNRFQPGGGGNQRPGGANQPAPDPASGARQQATPTSTILRVTSNRVQNTVTVVAEENILALIRKQVTEEWDKEVPKETVFATRIYQLHYQDPIKIRIALEGILGTGTVTGGGQNRATQSALSNQYTFQALPESGRLIVAGKTQDSLRIIDEQIEKLDTPMLTGVPEIIELKHVQAEDLAEQLNALLAQEGTLAQVRRVNTELSTGANAGASPFSESTFTQDGGFTQTTSQQDLMQFWWQRARPATDNFGQSNLVAKARIVPIAKQNSIMVLAPLEYKAALKLLIDSLDKPGRQVLIAAVIAEISGEDALSVGLRWSNSAITPTLQDNAFGIGPRANNTNTITGTQNNFLPDLFDTSVLDVGANINVLLQLLGQNTKVNILSEPKIFTGDNQEAAFFDGQDIPFITDSQPNTNGNLVQSFDYRAVGINLRVRPRITPERDVDLKVNLELSNILPQQTLFGGFIVDRRQTTTQLIVKDGQTVVMSGILRSEDSDIVRKVPGLGDVPLIGELFKSRERSKTTTELIAFITPLVVNNQADSDKINDGPRRRLEQLRKELSITPAVNGAPTSSPIDLGPPPADAGKPDPNPKPAPDKPADPAKPTEL